jgi:hypothetical protein
LNTSFGTISGSSSTIKKTNVPSRWYENIKEIMAQVYSIIMIT